MSSCAYIGVILGLGSFHFIFHYPHITPIRGVSREYIGIMKKKMETTGDT